MAPRGSGAINKDGYRSVFVGGSRRRALEHRLIMERILGRSLFLDETVHHENGVRDDNHPGNLELRVGAHPKGLSVEEAVTWAKEILRRYA
jgi:hypothetical protein